MSSHRLRRCVVPIALSALLTLGACASDDPEDTEQTPTEEASPEPTATIEVTGRDYSFTGIPVTIEAGTQVTFTNASTEEAHEIVAFNVPASESRPAAELFQLPEVELNAALGGPPAFVIIAAPEEDGTAVVGDGTLQQPGRYVFACFIPIGADPQEFMDAAQQSVDEAPVVGGGPPHFSQGMFAEATVE